jgi:hypothetical protein
MRSVRLNGSLLRCRNLESLLGEINTADSPCIAHEAAIFFAKAKVGARIWAGTTIRRRGSNTDTED